MGQYYSTFYVFGMITDVEQIVLDCALHFENLL